MSVEMRNRFLPATAFASLVVVWGMLSGCQAPSATSSAETVPTPVSDPLPSWNEGPAREAILDFVARVTEPGSPEFVPEAERIATFDNDGCLWSERPVYFQLLFAIDRVRELAPEHPEWQEQQPFKGVLEGDLEAVAASGEHGLLELVMASHAGMTTEEFEGIVREWLATARHPSLDRPFTELVYQPMLELLDYLRANGFKTFVVSGGGIEFMRPWVEEVYGIPPEQVVGSSIKVEYTDSPEPALVRLPEIDFIDDKAGKPVGIHKFIGRRPILAFGNSDGDFQMLEWVTTGEGPRLGVLIHHTDAEREWAYDRDSHVGRLDRGLAEASERGWLVVDMKADWLEIYPSSSGKAMSDERAPSS
jgi:phosphoglycolate phosphatase-like HAD superfamily hydrolase